MVQEPLFRSFFMGGFECSSHLRPNGQRLDLIAATEHDRHARADYQTLQAHGIGTVRDGLRWHLIEQTPGQYDFASALPLVRAARDTGTQVIWDLCHYGWPDDLDVFSPQFVERYARFCRAAATFLAQELDDVPFYTPINEISFLAWGGGDAAALNPYTVGRGFELKVQLVRAAIAGMDAVWAVDPRARMVHADPAIAIVADRQRPHEQGEAEGHRQAQFQAWDMLCGKSWPQLGGHTKYLDIVGVNFYPGNQWIHGGPPIDRFHPQYRWFSQMLAELHARYERPLLIAETGCEGAGRAEWLAYIGREVRLAQAAGVPVRGLCLYPILDYPGWEDDRHCQTGLLSFAADSGERMVDERLAAELAAQQALFAAPAALGAPSLSAARPAQPMLPALCLYTESTLPSGMGETMLALAAGLRDRFRVSLVCPVEEGAGQLLERAAALNVATFALPIYEGGPAGEVLRHWLRANPPAVFHCHAGISWEGLRGLVVAHGVGVRTIVRTEHLPYLISDPRDQERYRQAMAVVDQLICVSEGVRKSLLEAGVTAELIRVVHRAGPPLPPAGDRASVRDALGLAPADRLVLTVGRLTEQKGYLELLRAIELLAARGVAPSTQFVWAGAGPLAGRLRAELRAAGLEQRVQLIGHSANVAGLLAAADLFVLPSRFEGLPLALLEAMRAGLPVVGTRVGGIAEAVLDGTTGLLVEPERPAALAEAIKAALEPARARAWGAAGRARAAQRYGVEAMLAATRELYAQALGVRD